MADASEGLGDKSKLEGSSEGTPTKPVDLSVAGGEPEASLAALVAYFREHPIHPRGTGDPSDNLKKNNLPPSLHLRDIQKPQNRLPDEELIKRIPYTENYRLKQINITPDLERRDFDYPFYSGNDDRNRKKIGPEGATNWADRLYFDPVTGALGIKPGLANTDADGSAGTPHIDT